MAMPGNTAETFLVHFRGTDLTDGGYVVERFRARADGDIVPAPSEAPRAKGRRSTKRTTATLKAVREMHHACTEIIICTGLRSRGGWSIEDLDVAEIRNTVAEAVEIGRLNEPGHRKPQVESTPYCRIRSRPQENVCLGGCEPPQPNKPVRPT